MLRQRPQWPLDNAVRSLTDEALLVPRRVALPEDLDDLIVREPVGDRGTRLETPPELGARDVERRDALGDLVDRLVLVRIRKVGHLLERDHLDADLVRVLLDEVLRVVRAVEVFAGAVLARSGVVAADDEMGGAKVAADDGLRRTTTISDVISASPEASSHARRLHGDRPCAWRGATKPKRRSLGGKSR